MKRTVWIVEEKSRRGHVWRVPRYSECQTERDAKGLAKDENAWSSTHEYRAVKYVPAKQKPRRARGRMEP